MLTLFQDGIEKLERVYGIPNSKATMREDTIERAVVSAQVVSAKLCRLLYYVASGSIFPN